MCTRGGGWVRASHGARATLLILLTMDACFSCDETTETGTDRVHVDFLVEVPRKIWLDAGVCARAAVPNTLRAVFDKHPKFLNQLANKCVVLWPNDADTCIEVQRVVSPSAREGEGESEARQTTRVSLRVVDLLAHLETLPF